MASTSYADIKTMSANFKTALSNMEFPFPFDVENTSMVVLVDVENDLGDILAQSPDKLALIIGLDEGSPTVCILGANSSGEVLSAHLNTSLDGQQTWPGGQKIVYTDDTAYDNFFVSPPAP